MPYKYPVRYLTLLVNVTYVGIIVRDCHWTNYPTYNDFTIINVMLFNIRKIFFVGFHASLWNRIRLMRPTLNIPLFLITTDVARANSAKLFHGSLDNKAKLDFSCYRTSLAMSEAAWCHRRFSSGIFFVSPAALSSSPLHSHESVFPLFLLVNAANLRERDTLPTVGNLA